MAYITGSRYAETAHLTVKDLAAVVRAEVKDRVKTMKADGLLPAAAKVGVRYTTASMMQAIDVHLTVPEQWAQSRDRYGNATRTTARATVQRELLDLVESYNRKPAESWSGIRFYGDVCFDYLKEA